MRIVPLPLIALAVTAMLPAQPQLLIPLEPPPPPASCPAAMPGARTELTPAEQAAAQFHVPQLQGQKLARAVDQVAKALTWHESLADAAKAAREQDKPILWIQALGTLRGYT